MTGEPDFHLNGLQPADTASDLAERDLWARDLTVLAKHHLTGKSSRSCFVAHDASATWSTPGAPQLVAIDLTRNHDRGTFTCAISSHATMAFAQQWLIARGCPPAAITQISTDLIQPADDATLRIEEQIRTSGDCYELLSTYTWDTDDACWAWTMVRDHHADDGRIRVFLEDADLHSSAYTLRQATFPDQASAERWLDTLDGRPAAGPEPPSTDATMRARAAVSRSATGSVFPPCSGSWDRATSTTSTAPERHARGPK